GGARPDDVVVCGVRCGPAALTAGYRMPRASWNSSAETAKAASAGIARPAIGRPVLLVAVDVVGNLVVDRHVIHLGNGQLDAFPGAPAGDRDAHAAVVGHGHSAGVGRIDPHVVVVTTRAIGEPGDPGRLTSVERHGEGSGQVVGFVFVVRRYGQAEVIMRAAT